MVSVFVRVLGKVVVIVRGKLLVFNLLYKGLKIMDILLWSSPFVFVEEVVLCAEIQGTAETE